MLKLGVQVLTHKGGNVKLNDWKTLIEPTTFSDLDVNKLRGLDLFKARLVFQIDSPNDMDDLSKLAGDGKFSPGMKDLLQQLQECFADHPGY